MVNAQEQIEKFKEFLELNYSGKINTLITSGKKSLLIDFQDLLKFDHELAEELLNEPEETIKAAELSLEDMDIPKELRVRIRFFNFPKSQVIMIKDIRSNHLNKFLAIEGIVRQSSDVRPQVTFAKFECPSCGNTITIPQLDSKFKEPFRCSCGRKGRFRLLSKELVDAQRLIVEEAPEALEGGEQPKKLQVFLREDMVEPKMEKKTTPGSKIRVLGIVKEIPIMLGSGVQSIRYDLMMESNFIEQLEETFEELEINEEDEIEIKKLALDPRIYEKLIRSIAPSIYGHEDIKEALVLQLFGGVKKDKKDGTKIRGDMHLLLVGDPGSAKTTLLTAVSKIAPKSRFIAGKGISAAGITATVVKDEFLKGWALEAGALVLCNKGLLCLDEMDKIKEEDTGALHEAMESQIISIAKASIQACYSSDTEVLTDVGWKKYSEVKDLKIAQYNLVNNTLQFLPHKGLFIYDYKDKMYHFKNDRIDILVTPNHKMLAKEYSQNKYRSIEAEKLNYSHIQFINSSNLVGTEEKFFVLPPIKHKQNRKHIKYTHQSYPKKIPMNLWLEFLGYYLTEGGIQRKYSIGIAQKEGKNAEKIKRCLYKLSKYVGFTLSETKEKCYIRFQITNTQLFNFLENCGKKCSEKKFPLSLSFLSKKQLKILYDAMMLGDGSSDKKCFSSTSVELIDIFQAIACLIGKSASKHVQYKEKYRGNRLTLYRVSLSDKIEPSIRRKKIKKIDYNGKVFCFSTDTGFFITRRNGKIAIQGNTLRTETTILAAANPKFGRFDPYQPIAKQIDLPPALINRFDLIFTVKDIPKRDLDEKIAKHVLEIQQKPTIVEMEINNKLFKKYISYAKQKIIPKLSDGAIEEIKNFYVNLRNTESFGEEIIKPLPITARQLEALVRLAEASARVRLSKIVTKIDAKRAIRLLNNCLMQVGMDLETGQIDIDRIATGITASQRSKIVTVRELINELDSKGKKTIAIEEIISIAESKNIDAAAVEEVIDKLKKEGEIFEPRHGWISKI